MKGFQFLSKLRNSRYVEGVVTCAGVPRAAEGAGVPVLPVLVPEEEVLGVAPGEALRAHHAARHPAQLSVLPALDNRAVN